MRVGMQARVESCPTELTSLLRAWEEEHASADVYLTARPFQSWGGAAFQSLPLPVKEAIVDMGVCHYMVITRDANGVIRQWDFGPRGGDVHVDLPGSSLRPRPICSGRAATSMETVPLDDAPDEGGASSSFSSGGLRPGVPGEVRESVLLALPTHAPLMHVGKTSLSPQQIREFSVRQPTHYLLHKNDCRHYTNNLVCHMTGRERSTAHFLRKQYHNKVARDGALYHLHRPIVEAAQLVTDVSNWEAIRAATITGATVVMSVLGACLPFLGARLPLLLPPLRSMSGLVQLLPPLQSVPGILQLRLPASAARGALQTHAAAVSTALRERASGLLVAAPYVRGVEQHAARLKASAVARPALAAVSAFVSLSSSGVGFHNGGAIMMAQGSRGWPPPEAAMSMISWGGGADARGTRGCGALVAAAAPGGALVAYGGYPGMVLNGYCCSDDEVEEAVEAAVQIAKAVKRGVSLPVCLATDLVRFLHTIRGSVEEPIGGSVVSASFLNAKPAFGGIDVEPRRGGVLRMLFTVTSDAVANVVVRNRCCLSGVDPSIARHQALWPAFAAAKAVGKRAHFVLSIPVARGANWFLAGGGRRMDEEEATAAAAERIAAAAEDGTSLPVRLATDVVRFLYGGTGRREPADGGVVSASLLNAKPAVGGIVVEPRGGGVLRVLFTVASDAVADTVVRWRHELRRCVDSTAVFDVLSDREEAQHQALWPAFLAAKVAGKRAQFHRARLVVDGERNKLLALPGAPGAATYAEAAQHLHGGASNHISASADTTDAIRALSAVVDDLRDLVGGLVDREASARAQPQNASTHVGATQIADAGHSSCPLAGVLAVVQVQAQQIASLVDLVRLLLMSRVPGAPMQMPHAVPHAAHSAPRAAPAAKAAQPARPAAAAGPVASSAGAPAAERPAAAGAVRAASARMRGSSRQGLPSRAGDTSLRRSHVLSIPVAAANRLVAYGGYPGLVGCGCPDEEEEDAVKAAMQIAAAAKRGVSLPVRLATDVVRFLHEIGSVDTPAGGGVVSASFLNAKLAVGGIGVEPCAGGVLRVLFTVASDAVADVVVRNRCCLSFYVDSSAAVFDVLSDREEAQHQGLWPAFVAAKAAGKRAQFQRARLVVDGERVAAPACYVAFPLGVCLKGRWRHTRAVAGAVWSLSRVLRRVPCSAAFGWLGVGLLGPFMVLASQPVTPGVCLWLLQG
ncbi:hypothetical protein FOA52_015503 [Chlamydomonas sp. UWO 241]|nr:hypothetical protein FOA52_015503 [Chlamydomonas sp. UWO 241]